MGILRELFGPSKDEMWRQLCREIGADFVEGGFWDGGKVVGRVKQWTVTLDTYMVAPGKPQTTQTRIRAPYVNKDGFRFAIYRKSIFTHLGKFLGMQDVEVGYPEFDENFVIQGNDERKLRLFFANPKIRNLIESQPSFWLGVKDDEGWFGASFPEGVDELCFETLGVITEVERLRQLYELFAEVLNYLCHIGSACEDNPMIALK